MSTDVSKYLLLDRIAVGGMAEVYRAKSLGVEGFEKIIAIKRILPSLAEDDEFVSMFIEEAKIAGQLSHANIAPIYELGKIDGTHFIAMQYVWGKDLLQIIERHRAMRRTVDPMMAAWIISKVLEGLDYAHRKRGVNGQPLAIIHRDVSPQNLIVSYDGLVKVIDFGIAKAASRASQTQAGVVKGKLGYMSPEQITGLPLDHRSDIFAASTCFHEMITCKRLFAGRSDIEVIEKVRMAKAPRPSELGIDMPPALEDILMKGLARDPNARWSSAGEMQEALMPLIATTRPPFGTSRLGDWMRTAFAPEIAEEKAHLDKLNGIARPGQQLKEQAREQHEHIGFDDDEDEPTIMQRSPFADAPEPLRPSQVEVSVMVVVDEGEGLQEHSLMPPVPVTPQPAPAAHPDPFQPVPARGFAQTPTPTVPGVEPASFGAPANLNYPRTDPLVGIPPEPVYTPAVDRASLAPPSDQPAAAPAPKGRGFVGCLLVILLVVVVGAGAAIGFWFTGGDAFLRARFPDVFGGGAQSTDSASPTATDPDADPSVAEANASDAGSGGSLDGGPAAPSTAPDAVDAEAVDAGAVDAGTVDAGDAGADAGAVDAGDAGGAVGAI